MIKFEEHEGLLFKMLEEPVPLKENDENVLVRFITHGVIGEYVMAHWLDCNQPNVPIYIDDVDSDGDVTVWIENENGNEEHHCCPFPMFEIIGTLVEEGSKEWALYQMMQGEKVCHEKSQSIMYCEHAGYIRREVRYNCVDHMSVSVWLDGADNTGWQIYHEPKPLLAEAKVGDLCQRRDGKWMQIDEIDDEFSSLPPAYRCGAGWWTEKGASVHNQTLDIVHTEPLAPEGTEEWALQMMKLGKKVIKPNSISPYILKANHIVRYGDNISWDVGHWLRVFDDTIGWQIYKEPKPKPQYKVGDFVEIRNWYSGTTHLAQIDSIDHEIHIGTLRFDISGESVMERVPQLSVTRKLKPSQVIVRIGCLSGTVAHSVSEDCFLLAKVNDPQYRASCIDMSMLDTETRSLVESLLKAQEEE